MTIQLTLTVDIGANPRTLRLVNIVLNSDSALAQKGKVIVLDKRAQSYSWALLLLFSKFRQHQGSAAFRLEKKHYQDEVKSLRELMSNAKPKEDEHGQAQEQRDKWSSMFLRVNDPERPELHFDPDNVDEHVDLLVTKNDEIKFTDRTINPSDVNIVLLIDQQVRRPTDPPVRILESDSDYAEFGEILDVARNPFDCMAFEFAKGAIRQDLNYTVNFGEEPIRPQGSPGIDKMFEVPDYYHFHATMVFDRLSLNPHRSFSINVTNAGAIDPNGAVDAEDGSSRDVIYGEEFEALPDHACRLREILNATLNATQEKRYQEALATLADAFFVNAKVDGTAAVFAGIEVTLLGGFILRFQVPDNMRSRLKHRYQFEFTAFWPRKRLHFPMMLSESTRKGTMLFDFGRAELGPVNLFLGTQRGVGENQRARGRCYAPQKKAEVKWDNLSLFPGQGAVVFWKGATSASDTANGQLK
jgi:hypothetical protein